MKKVTRFVQVMVLAATMLFGTTAWAQTTLLSESFDVASQPAGWTQVNEVGAVNWVFGVVGGYNSNPPTTHSGAGNARLYNTSDVRTLLITPSLNFGTNPLGTLTFWHTQAIWPSDQDTLSILYRTSPTGTWTRIAGYQNNITTWTQETVNLPNVSGTYQIAFQGYATYGYGVCLDDVLVTAMSAPPAPPITITIGTGSTPQGNYPYNTYWHDNRTQFILLASEIHALGGAAGNITSYGLYVSATSAQIMNGFNFRMAHTTLTSLTGFQAPAWTTCVSTNMAAPAVGWQNIPFTTPFVWNGTDNILVEICFDNTSYTSTKTVLCTSQSTNMTWAQYADNSTGCAFAGGSGYVERPNIRLQVPPIAGSLTGNVKSCYNNAVIPTPTITIGTNIFTGYANGSYLLNYPVGTYNVQASAAGYLPKTKSATIAENQTTILDFCLDPIPATVTGVVTNCATGAPVIGAKVALGSSQTYSTGPNGAFALQIYPAATGQITVTKDGFDQYLATSATYTPPNNYTLNICLNENVNVPVNVVATLNTAQTAVDVTWGIPVGNYQLIYDDGIAENFAIWATAGNKNAVKFTPLQYPITLTKAKINIGTVDNYPQGANPLQMFKVAVYDAAGPGGTPGAPIVAPFDFTPPTFGWNDIPIPSTTITSGSFYIVMIQGGTPPDAAGLAVDTTTQQLRSYSQFGTGPWIPASGNFMIRAIVSGAGGPLKAAEAPGSLQVTATAVPNLIYQYTPGTYTGLEGIAQIVAEGDSPDVITGYQVWRLKQGEEGNQALWTTIGTPTATNITDPSWPSLACGPYLWAVKAQYTGNRWSNPAFSNVLGKCWIANVTVNVDLSCDSLAPEGATVKLVNVTYPDTIYTAVTGATGTVIFDHVWKGIYNLTVTKFDYTTFALNNISIMGDMVLNPILLQIKAPPTGLDVDDRSLWATWNAPVYTVPLFSENWSSGSFATNQWVIAGGTNWIMATGLGNPAPSAEFYYNPSVTGYSQTLTSKDIAGVGSEIVQVQFDLYLDNYGTTTLEQMALEVWDGTAWHSIANYDNSGNDIPWTTETADASQWIGGSTDNFKIRFRAYGEDSFNINNWNIDNIKILAATGTPDPCLIGYNFYLNNVLSAYIAPTATSYRIPPSQVDYGTTYNACVLAIYGSGYSTTSCDIFTSHFLYPPMNIQAQAVEDVAYITWNKPVISDTVYGGPLKLVKYNGPAIENTSFSTALAPKTGVREIKETDAPLGSIVFGFEAFDDALENFDLNNVAGATTIGPNTTSNFISGMTFPQGESNLAVGNVYGETNLYTLNRTTGAITSMGSYGSSAVFQAMTTDATTGIIYATSGTDLYTVNPAVPSVTLLGSHGGGIQYMIGIACDPSTGILYGYSLEDNFYTIDKTNGAATVVGAIGYNANYAQDAFWDQATSTFMMAAYNLGNSMCEIRAVDKTTGSSVVLSSAGSTEFTGTCLPLSGSGGGGTPDGLIGYNVYRDDAFLHFVPDPDTLWYYDFDVEPNTYCYDVTAVYDLTDYGFPGQFDESLVAPNGPACVSLNYGVPIPFYEPWDMGSFGFNNWTSIGANWSVNAGFGNPAPAADFSWQPIIHDYEQAIETPTLSAGAWTCAGIWLDFDVKLVDRNATGDEKLLVEIYSNGDWAQKAEFSNTGSMDWTPSHIDIKGMQGKAFKVRFRATGANSDDILHWYVDNIHVYGICKSPTFEPSGVSQSQFTTTLTWAAPVCAVPTQIIKLFQWDGTPDNGYFQNYDYGYGVVYDLTTYPDAKLNKIDYHHASWGTTGTWQYKIHIVDWTTYTEFATVGPLTTTGNDIWEENILLGDIEGLGGKQVGIILEPMSNSATDAYPCFSADNIGPDGVSVFGPLADYSAMAPSGIGDFLQNLWIEIPLEDGSVTFVPNRVNVSTIQNNSATRVAAPVTNNPGYLMTNQTAQIVSNNADSSHIMGYNVWRTDGTGTGPFTKLNASPVTALTYADVHPSTTEPGQTYKYYITALFEDDQNPGTPICEPASDTVTVAWPALGLNDLANNGIRMYPNPATDHVNVEATSNIISVEVLNFLGQSIYTVKDVNKTSMTLNVTGYQSGVYFVKVTTVNGTKSVKITVTR